MKEKKLMIPQPPEDTVKVEQFSNTDSFQCLDSMGYFMAVVHRTIGL